VSDIKEKDLEPKRLALFNQMTDHFDKMLGLFFRDAIYLILSSSRKSIFTNSKKGEHKIRVK